MKKHIRFLSWILLLSMLLSLSGCKILDAVEEKKQKAELEEAVKTYYETKVSAFEEENQTLSGVDVVFIGDSLTEGYNLELFYPEYKTVNRGIGGDTTFGVEKRLKVSAYDLNPKVVVLLIGGNNLGTMFENYSAIVEQIRTNLPNTEVVLLSLTALGKTLADKNDKVRENNIEIQRVASDFGCTYIDLFTVLYDEKTGEIYEDCTKDGAHLTGKGYTFVTLAVKPILAEILDET